MKKIFFIILAIIIIIAVIIGLTLLNKEDTKTNLNISSFEDMENLISRIYEGLEETIPQTLTTTEVDLSNSDVVKSYTGLESTDGIKLIVASEPMISSQAYSLVLVQAEDSTRASEIAKEMSEKANPVKWLCVSAEKVYTTSSGDIAILVMADSEWADPVYENFKKEAGNIGEEYQKTMSE